MATYRAVAAVGQAIVGLLQGASRPAEFADAQFRRFRTEDFNQPIESGISIYLYRITIDHASRNLPSVNSGGGREKRPLPLNLHYLLTPWGADAASEHQMLTWAMRVLGDAPVLPSALLNEANAGVFDESEDVELFRDDLTATDAINLWRGLRLPYRLGVLYIARGVRVD
ncbi:MAG TPA: DUF4255 domain-containing protein [Pyrinomonadaceae bacterium]|nr:DUF4255 domain-containing protein [Pyrinomonadaceae bacterium]